MLTAYAVANHPPRQRRNLYARLPELLESLRAEREDVKEAARDAGERGGVDERRKEARDSDWK